MAHGKIYPGNLSHRKRSIQLKKKIINELNEITETLRNFMKLLTKPVKFVKSPNHLAVLRYYQLHNFTITGVDQEYAHMSLNQKFLFFSLSN